MIHTMHMIKNNYIETIYYGVVLYHDNNDHGSRIGCY